MRPAVLATGVVLVLLAAPSRSGPVEEWAFADWREEPERVEEFLRSAEVVASREVPIGITRPRRLTLELDGVRADAAFKTVDEYEAKVEFDDGSYAINFRDSYKNELAAYELDRMLGLGLVPPTVERRIGDETGAARLWIEGAISEAERSEKGIQAPDPVAWSDRVADLRLFYSLTGNTDYNNVNNTLIDGGFRICAIDHSRAFQVRRVLVGEPMLLRFSRRLLAALEALDDATLEARLGQWLSRQQIKSLLKRRDLVLERVEDLVALKGEELVLFD